LSYIIVDYQDKLIVLGGVGECNYHDFYPSFLELDEQVSYNLALRDKELGTPVESPIKKIKDRPAIPLIPTLPLSRGKGPGVSRGDGVQKDKSPVSSRRRTPLSDRTRGGKDFNPLINFNPKNSKNGGLVDFVSFRPLPDPFHELISTARKDERRSREIGRASIVRNNTFR